MLGYCLTGSFCCFKKSIEVLRSLAVEHEIMPIMSYNAYDFDTKFGKAADFNAEIKAICKKEIVHTIQGAEPIGPTGMLDCLIICPCTGNTLSKLAHGICDTPVTMAAKAHLRNGKPLVIAISTNDGLSGSALSLARLLQRKNIYFVPFSQDAPTKKPCSLVCNFDKVHDTVKLALEGRQIQPILER